MLGLQLGINRSGGALSNLASKAGAVMHLDVSDLVSPTVIRDKQQGNNATMYNFADTAASGILNTDSRIAQLVNKLGSNGNFTTDTSGDGVGDGFNCNMTGVSMINNVQTLTSSTRNQYINRVLTWSVGDIVYHCAYINSTQSVYLHTNVGVNVERTLPTSGNVFHSSRAGYSSGGYMSIIYNNATTGITNDIQISKWHVFNLTEIFGAGNEPSKADMDRMIQAYYNTGGVYIGSTPPILSTLRPCKKYDGVDDYMRVLTPSAATNITTEEFAIGCIVYITTSKEGYLICRNGSSSGDVQYGIYISATDYPTFLVAGSIRAATAAPIAKNAWNAIIVHRNTAGDVSILVNGTVSGTGTYTSALVSAANLMLGCRSNNTDGTLASVLSNAYVNHEFISVGSRATIANVKAFQAEQAAKYGITYNI